MYQSEVTVQVFDDYNTIAKRLTDLGYSETEEFLMKDHYFSGVKNVEGVGYKDLIKDSFIVRCMQFEKPKSLIIYKDKLINENDEVVSEHAIKVPIEDSGKAVDIFLKSGLNNWCEMTTKITVFEKDKQSLYVQVVDNLGIFIEYEEDETMENLSVVEKRNQMTNTLKGLKLNIGEDFSCKKVYMLLERMQENKVTNSNDYLNSIVTVKIDRELGTKHPKHGFIYPVNYGYIPNTMSGDGEELDAYVLGVDQPVKEFEGRVIAIIHRLNDNDDKLVVVKDGENYTDEEIYEMVNFQEQWFKSEIIRN